MAATYTSPQGSCRNILVAGRQAGRQASPAACCLSPGILTLQVLLLLLALLLPLLLCLLRQLRLLHLEYMGWHMLRLADQILNLLHELHGRGDERKRGSLGAEPK